MANNYYTHALWHVKEGRTDEFIAAWKKFGETLSRLPGRPALEGTLIQNLNDPLVFYSFGPWESLEFISLMRNDASVKEALSAIVENCQEARPGNYKTVLRLSYPAVSK